MICTYIPVERRPNCDNVALHEIICVMSMNNEWKLSSASKASFDQKPLWPWASLGSGDWVQGERKDIGTPDRNCSRTFKCNRFFCALLQRFFFLVSEYGTSCNSRGQESVTTWTKEKNCRNVRWCQIKRVGINREQGKQFNKLLAPRLHERGKPVVSIRTLAVKLPKSRSKLASFLSEFNPSLYRSPPFHPVFYAPIIRHPLRGL